MAITIEYDPDLNTILPYIWRPMYPYSLRGEKVPDNSINFYLEFFDNDKQK